MAYRFDNMDASESVFLAKQLEFVRAKSYDIKYEALKGRLFCPVDNSVSPGAETVTYRQYDQFGLAKIIANYADDLPRADVKAAEFTSKIRSIGASYGYSIQEVRAAQFAGVPLEQRKANAARKAVEEKIDSIAKVGDASHGLLGLLNQPNTTSFTVPNGAGGLATWASKNAYEILADMHAIVNAIVESTKEVEQPTDLILPLSQYGLVSTTPMQDGNNATILEFFLKTSPYVKTVSPWTSLTGAGAGVTDRMVCYKRDPDVLQLIIPQEFEQMPPQAKGLEVVTPVHARCGGVVCYFPLAIAYGDGI